jgi:hypothetical protein
MGEQYIGDVFSPKPTLFELGIQVGVSMQMVMAEEFLRLLISNARVHEQKLISLFNKERAHSPGAHIACIRRDMFLPKGFWNHSKHGSAIQFKVARMYRVQLHEFSILFKKRGIR